MAVTNLRLASLDSYMNHFQRGVDLEFIVSASDNIEWYLEKYHGASGSGLHAKVSSVEHNLPENTTRHARRIARIRNQLIHDSTVNEIRDFARFEESCLYFAGLSALAKDREKHLD